MLNLFKNIRGVKILLSEKKDGNMKLFSFGFEESRKKFLSKNKLDYKKLVSAKLAHGSNVEIIENSNHKFIDYCDGLLTQNPEIILSTTSADCLPVYVFDSKKRVVGMLHCSWKSVSKELVENCVTKMKEKFGSVPASISVAIGPGIQKCHFEVGEELLEKFIGYEKFFSKQNEKLFLDLKGVVKEKFIDLGISEDQIEVDSRCTVCDDKLWSYRRDGVDKNGDVQAMTALIKLAE